MTSHIPATLLAAPATVQGIHGGQIFGTVGLSGLSLACAIVMLLGVRKSDRLKFLHHRDGAGAFAVFTGSVWIAAQGAWASVATGFYSVPTSLMGGGSGLPALKPGGVALVLVCLTFLPRWKRMIIPSFLGVSAAVSMGIAGGAGGVLVNLLMAVVGHFTGGA